MNTCIKLIPILALAALLSGLSPVSNAASIHSGGPKMTVRFADLNLTKPQDVEVLYRRIRLAARLVCTDASDPWDVARNRRWTRCFNSAMENAIQLVDRPVLTALHQERIKRAG